MYKKQSLSVLPITQNQQLMNVPASTSPHSLNASSAYPQTTGLSDITLLQDVFPSRHVYTFPSLYSAKYLHFHTPLILSLTNTGVSTSTFDQSTIPRYSAISIRWFSSVNHVLLISTLFNHCEIRSQSL